MTDLDLRRTNARGALSLCERFATEDRAEAAELPAERVAAKLAQARAWEDRAGTWRETLMEMELAAAFKEARCG